MLNALYSSIAVIWYAFKFVLMILNEINQKDHIPESIFIEDRASTTCFVIIVKITIDRSGPSAVANFGWVPSIIKVTYTYYNAYITQLPGYKLSICRGVTVLATRRRIDLPVKWHCFIAHRKGDLPCLPIANANGIQLKIKHIFLVQWAYRIVGVNKFIKFYNLRPIFMDPSSTFRWFRPLISCRQYVKLLST